MDVWSVGCIFAELLTHEAFFQGNNPQHQLEVIVRKIGLPRTASKSMEFIDEQSTRFAVSSYEHIYSLLAANNLSRYIHYRVPQFASYFPRGSNPLALELLSAMLQFNPDERYGRNDIQTLFLYFWFSITVEAALLHPYLKDFQGQVVSHLGYPTRRHVHTRRCLSPHARISLTSTLRKSNERLLMVVVITQT